MEKAQIVLQIQRAAAANGGEAPGWRRFAATTGIKYADWCGVHWARWNEALRDAGFAPNQLTEAYEDATLLDFYSKLAGELSRLPTGSDLRLKTKRDPTFPSDKTFARLGSKLQLATKLIPHCRNRPEFAKIVIFASDYVSTHDSLVEETPREKDGQSGDDQVEGFVYMMRLGKHYKIGHTTAVPRRHREIALELPEKPSTVHYIRTDDPEGIERYWHGRFAALRANGEWFSLTQREVRAFKRRKFM